MKIKRISNEVLIEEIFENDIKDGTMIIPDGVTKITYSNASNSKLLFSDSIRASITSIVIPKSVKSIVNFAFADCSSLNNIYVKNNSNYCDIDGVLFNKRKTKLIFYPKGNTRTHYEIPDKVQYICDGAFYDCTSLTNLTIPEGVTTIGVSAFSSCTSLKGITIPNSVTYIGVSAFSSCTSLKGITIPNSVTYIGGSAFQKCSSLTSITIPENVTSVGNYAFNECTSLKNIKVAKNNTVYYDVDGVLFVKEVIAMECIKRIIENKGYEHLPLERVYRIAKREFCKFDDDDLKIEFLKKCFEHVPKEELSCSPRQCAECLVEGGTFEGGWNVLYSRK